MRILSKAAQELTVLDTLPEVITLVRGEIENQRVSVRIELANELPPVFQD
jgi:hypothetical protein